MTVKSLVYLGTSAGSSDRFPWLANLLNPPNIKTRSTTQTVALLPFVDFATPWQPDAEVLAFALPARLAANVSELAAANLTAFNSQSADLLASRTLLALETDQMTVQFPALSLPLHFPDMGVDTFYVAVASGEQLAVVKHEHCSADMESLVVGLQGCCLSSGNNYKPYRIWPEEVLAAHSGLQDQDEDDTIECTVVSHLRQTTEPII